MTPELQEAICAEALTWERTPYHHQGFVKGVGVDCAFFLIKVYHSVGLIPDIDPRPYPMDWHLHRDAERYLGWVEQYATQVEEPVKGGLAVFKFGRCYSHGTIVLEWPSIIHAYRLSRGVYRTNVLHTPDLSKRLDDKHVKFYQLKEA